MLISVATAQMHVTNAGLPKGSVHSFTFMWIMLLFMLVPSILDHMCSSLIKSIVTRSSKILDCNYKNLLTLNAHKTQNEQIPLITSSAGKILVFFLSFKFWL